MRAGLLEHVIEIWKPVVVIDEYGEQLQQMQFSRTTRARIIHKSGQQTVTNNEIVYPYLFTFETYRYNDIKEVDEIRYKGQRYNILSVVDDRYKNNKTIECQIINE